jgi:predicted Zn-ribbon and HTH transcriptional regulator
MNNTANKVLMKCLGKNREVYSKCPKCKKQYLVTAEDGSQTCSNCGYYDDEQKIHIGV